MSDYRGLSGDDLIFAIAGDLFSAISIVRHQLNSLERLIMVDLDQLLTEMQSQSSMITELSTTVATLSKHAADHADGTVVSPAVQSKIEALMNSAVANKALLSDTMQLAVKAVQAMEGVKANLA